MNPDNPVSTKTSALAKFSSEMGGAGLLLFGSSLVFFFLALIIGLLSAKDVRFFVFCGGAFLAFSAFCGVCALVCAGVARSHIAKSGGTLGGHELLRKGFLTGGINLGLIVVSIFLFLAFRYQWAKQGRTPDICLLNLRNIDGAKEQWALENKKTQTDTPTWDDLVGTNKYIKVMPICPQNGIYTIGPVNRKPTCSIKGHTLQ